MLRGSGEWQVGEAGSRVKDGRATAAFPMLLHGVERVFTVLLESVGVCEE
jgi:hypothetical protein